MKTTISINLGGSAFTIDDDAYRELKHYLDTLSNHFNREEGGDEIMTDIEARIAEEFSRKRENGIEVISIPMVREIIARMGRVEDLTGEHEEVIIEEPYFARSDAEKEHTRAPKRLYRDPDHAMLAGVAAGLGAYFNVDPSIPRIIFVLLTLFGGSGILIYIILWLVLPEADTPLKQSELRGESPTIKDIEKKFKDMFETGKKKISEIDTTKAKETVTRAAHSTSHAVTKTTATVVRNIARIAGLAVGICITVGSFVAMMALTFFAPFILINSPERYIDFPVSDILTVPLQYVFVFGAYLTLMIPVIFVFLIGLSFLRWKNSIRPGLGFSLFGVWCVALVAVGIVVATGFFNLNYDHDSTRFTPDYRIHLQEKLR